jgi:outer membrane immunogenic protein
MLNRIVPAFAALLVAAPALAGDFYSAKYQPAPAPFVGYDWTGFYLGADLGATWQQGRFTPAAPPAVTVNGFSVLGGGFLGYNRQFGSLVIGLEGDIQAPSVSNWDPTGVYLIRQHVLGAVNGRLGYAFDRVLLYVIGGVAFTDTNYNVAGVKYNAGGSGFDIGAGIEYAVTPRWAVRGEYRYYDFGKTNNVAVPVTFQNTQNTFRVGVAYKFGVTDPGPVVAKY